MTRGRTTWVTVFAVALAVALIARAATGTGTTGEGGEEEKTGKGRRLAVVGYVPEYRYGAIDWAGVSARVTHVILFSLEVGRDGSVAAQERFPDAATYAAARAATRRTGARLLVCFGGAGRSANFGAVATSAALRRVFVRSVHAFVAAHGLDGVDLDWEAPRTRAEWAGLGALVGELGAVLRAHGRVLTMAVHPGQERLLPRAALGALDLVLVMAYDNLCAHGEAPPCEHATYAFAARTVAAAVRAGVPPAKLALGVPFYARDVRTGAAETYAALAQRHGVAARPAADRAGAWYYNGPRTLARKARLAHTRGLGGLMVWELGQDVRPDAPGSLLAALDAEVRRLAGGDSGEGDSPSDAPQRKDEL